MREDEAYSPTCLVVWAMATKTEGFVMDRLGIADQDSPGTQFLIKAGAASASLWKERFKLRVEEIRHRHGLSMAKHLKSIRGRSRDDEPEDDDGSGDPHEGPDVEDPNDAAEPHMMEL